MVHVTFSPVHLCHLFLCQHCTHVHLRRALILRVRLPRSIGPASLNAARQHTSCLRGDLRPPSRQDVPRERAQPCVGGPPGRRGTKSRSASPETVSQSRFDPRDSGGSCRRSLTPLRSSQQPSGRGRRQLVSSHLRAYPAPLVINPSVEIHGVPWPSWGASQHDLP